MFNIIEFARSAKRKISYYNLLPIIFIFLMFAACPAYAGSAPSTDILVQCNSSGVVTNNTAITGVNLPTIQYDSTGNFHLNSVDVAVYSGSTLVKELDGYTTTNLQVALGAVTNYDYNGTNPVIYAIKYRGHYGIVGQGAQDITEDWQSSGLYFEVVPTPPVVTTGTISGTVTDINNTPLSGADVTVSGSVYSATTTSGVNFTLTANQPGTYSVTFDSQGGSSVSSINNVTTGSAISAPAAPTRSSYTFGGWYKEAACTNAWNFGTDKVTANITLYAQWTANPTYSGGGDGGYNSSPTPSTINGSVIDGTTGAKISNLTATISIDRNGNYTITMKAAQIILLKQPDRSISPLGDISQVAIAGAAGTPVTIAPDGTIQVPNLVKGTDNKFNITYDLGSGQKITIGTMNIQIDSSGAINLTTSLIDPYGIITDAATGKALAGVNVTLYYAGTERNKAAGKTPDTVVALPSIAGFKPNNNQDPQTSDSSGAYGFMVFPTTDYYIVAAKDGYDPYTSPTISVEQEIVHWDFKMSPTTSGVTRLAGQSRVDTALAIAQAEYTGKVSNVILATADNYPDALAGSVLACKVNAPILLVGSSDGDQAKVLDYLKSSLDPAGTVYILGGTAVVSSTLENEVAASGFTHIVRIAGTDRYQTSAEIADQLAVKTGTPLVLVSGENYPDALSVSSIAAQMQFPILLVQKDGISDSVRQEIAAIKPNKVYIIGGEGVISAAVANQAAQFTGLAQMNIIRIGGTDRYATSLAVAQYFNLTGQNVCIATGGNFPDALAGSVYAANHNAPIILVDDSLPDQAITYLKTRKLTGAAIFGGEAAVSQDVEQQLAQLIGQ